MAFFNALLAFIVAIAILVAIHEFGHFWVAKKLNVKVLRFSIGFGKVLKSWQRGETRYTLCALPLGGFVKMLDENETAVDPSEKHRAFNTQNVYKRFAIVLAGPLANFILAIIIYTLIFILGSSGIKPIVGDITSKGIAEQAGLEIGDQLLSINQHKTPTIQEFSSAFMQFSDQDTINFKVLSNNNQVLTLSIDQQSDFLTNPEIGIEKYLGFKFALPEFLPVIHQVVKNSPADLVGLQAGDKILMVDDTPIKKWIDFSQLIQLSAGKQLTITLERQHQHIQTSILPINTDGNYKIGVSVKLSEQGREEWLIKVKKSPFDAFISANQKVLDLTILNLKMIKKMLLGDVSSKHISGPIGIADYAGKTAEAGFISFLSFLALISIGLGLLNLLPIPMLDGGHLFLYIIEIIKGSPVSQKTQQGLLKFGLMLILSLTVLAMYNDFSRLLS